MVWSKVRHPDEPGRPGADVAGVGDLDEIVRGPGPKHPCAGQDHGPLRAREEMQHRDVPDALGRTIVERPATANDISRLRAL